MASIIDSSMEVFPAFGKFSQRSTYKDKDERKRLIETTAQQRNQSKTSSSMSVASTLYTRGYFAAPNHCRSVFFEQYCKWYSASVFADARERFCQRRTVNRAYSSNYNY